MNKIGLLAIIRLDDEMKAGAWRLKKPPRGGLCRPWAELTSPSSIWSQIQSSGSIFRFHSKAECMLLSASITPPKCARCS